MPVSPLEPPLLSGSLLPLLSRGEWDALLWYHCMGGPSPPHVGNAQTVPDHQEWVSCGQTGLRMSKLGASSSLGHIHTWVLSCCPVQGHFPPVNSFRAISSQLTHSGTSSPSSPGPGQCPQCCWHSSDPGTAPVSHTEHTALVPPTQPQLLEWRTDVLGT